MLCSCTRRESDVGSMMFDLTVKMDTSLRVILTAWCALMTTLPVTANNALCPDSTWSYHAETSSCIKLFTENRDYSDANRYCGTFRDAKNNPVDGHLVYIFDKDTDTFVKDLLPGNDTHGIIGLNDIDTPGVYKWGQSTQGLSYTGWEQGEPSELRELRRVIMRTTGWRKFQDSKAFFFCQLEEGNALDEDTSNPVNNTGLIAGLCTAIVCLLIIVVIVVVLYRWKKRKRPKKVNVYAIPEPISASDEHTYMTVQNEEQVYSVIDDGSHNTEPRVRSDESTTDDGYITPVSVEPYNSQDEVNTTQISDNRELAEEGYIVFD